MRNGQLKPAYNVQIVVSSEYITGIEVFSARTDFCTTETDFVEAGTGPESQV